MPSATRKHKTPQEEQPDETDASDASLDDLPDEIDPYETLNLTKEATEEQVKKAYRKAALVNHPDKVPAEDKEHATERFKKVAFAYAILSDPAKRKRYDTTGRTDEAVSVDDDFNWTDYYQELYTDLVTPETITRFIEEYKGSDEERQHVLNAYSRFKGDMTRLYEHVMASNVLEDDSRFRTMIDQAIKDEEVQSHSKYVNETEKSKKARIRKAEQEAAEAEEELKDERPSRSGKSAGKKNPSKKKDGGLGDLAALIQRKQEGKGDAFLDKLAEKYGAKETKSGKKRGSAAIDEPPEEAFAKNRKRGKAA